MIPGVMEGEHGRNLVVGTNHSNILERLHTNDMLCYNVSRFLS